jgi:hypothetical protein
MGLVHWLPWAEFCYNSAYQSALCTSPFQVVYGREPLSVRAYTVAMDGRAIQTEETFTARLQPSKDDAS